MLRAQLGLIITSSSALESEHSLIKVWAMVCFWVWTMVWRWSDQNSFGLESLIRTLWVWKVWSEIISVWKIWSEIISVWKVWSEIILVWKVWSEAILGLDLNLGWARRWHDSKLCASVQKWAKLGNWRLRFQWKDWERSRDYDLTI